MLPHLQPRMERLSDFAPAAAYLASGMLPLTEQSFAEVKLEREALAQLLQFAQWRLEGVSPWERDAIFAAMKELADQMGLKIRDFLAPLFIAIAGTAASISVIDSMHMLGSDLVARAHPPRPGGARRHLEEKNEGRRESLCRAGRGARRLRRTVAPFQPKARGIGRFSVVSPPFTPMMSPVR